MATQVKFRRGTTAQHQSFTGGEGEITVDTTKDTAVVHDGSTAGGHPLAKASEARGWTTTEHFTANDTWTKIGKTGLKRIKVTVWGGGGGGARGDGNDEVAGGAASGGHGYVILEADQVTDNVSITIGQGGNGATSNGNGSAGGTTSFGSYIQATGGAGGIRNTGAGGAAAGGRASGSGVVELGSFTGSMGVAEYNENVSFQAPGGGPGGGAGNGGDAHGVCGGGGGGSINTNAGNGAQGSVLIEEIYGEV